MGILRFVSSLLATTAYTRVLLAGFGQSNMGTFFRSTLNTIVPNANVSFYNGDSTWSGGAVGLYHPLTVGEVGDGILTCMNKINNVTGLPVLALQGAVGGSPVGGLIPGVGSSSAVPPTDYFEQFIAQINANILSTDYLIVLWDQGEGDAVGSEKPQDYIDNLKLVRDGIASSLSRPNVAMLVAGLGTIQGLTGAPNQGNSPYRWQGVRNAHFYSGIQIPHVFYSRTNIDIERPGGDFHYAAPTITRIGEGFAQGTTNLLGIGTPGFAHWEIANAATVNATQTNVNFVHSLGTDFNPTSNADGWEVSGDNGANWVTATGARNSATQLQLTHSSLSTGSARLVRYQWGYNQAGNSTGPTPGYLRDNSTLAVPLTPTTWDIRPSGASSVVPCATWRNTDDLTGPHVSPYITTSRKLLCWPITDNYQKFLIIAVYSGFAIDMVGDPLTIKVQPDVGAQVTATFVAQHPGAPGLALFQAPLGTDAKGAQYVTVTASQASYPFTGYTFHIFDVDTASLSSTTNTGTNSATTTLTANTTPVTANCTVNASAGGLMISMNTIDVAQSGAFATYSSNFNNRWEDGSSITLDAVNAANGSNSFSVTFGTTNPSAPINMYTLMASWK